MRVENNIIIISFLQKSVREGIRKQMENERGGGDLRW